MKVFCRSDNRTAERELDKFVGKDVWILCRRKQNLHRDDWSVFFWWIKVADATLDKYIVWTHIAGTKNSIQYSFDESIKIAKQQGQNLKELYKFSIEPVHPLEIFTDDELFSESSNVTASDRIDNRHSFSYYLGKDLWVKCICDQNTANPQVWWVRIVEALDEPGAFVANLIAGPIIRNGSNDHISQSEKYHLISDEFIIEEKEFTIDDPIEISSTDDLFGE